MVSLLQGFMLAPPLSRAFSCKPQGTHTDFFEESIFLHKKTSELDGWFSNSTMTELWVGISVILFLPSLTLPFVVTQGWLQEFQKCVITR